MCSSPRMTLGAVPPTLHPLGQPWRDAAVAALASTMQPRTPAALRMGAGQQQYSPTITPPAARGGER